MNRGNSRLQNTHLAKSNIGRYYETTTTEKFKNSSKHEKAMKAFKHMPDYSTERK